MPAPIKGLAPGRAGLGDARGRHGARRRRKTSKAGTSHRARQGPRHLPMGSAGIRGEGEGEGTARKHGGPERRVRRKIHVGIDEKTPEIRAAEFTASDIDDAPVTLEVLEQVPLEQEIASATTEGALDTRRCGDAITARGAAAIIPPARTPSPAATSERSHDTTSCAPYGASWRLGRIVWRRWSGSRRPSRSETAMHCVKVPGQRRAARDFDRQVAEFQFRAAVAGGRTARGISVAATAGHVRQETRKPRPSAVSWNGARKMRARPAGRACDRDRLIRLHSGCRWRGARGFPNTSKPHRKRTHRRAWYAATRRPRSEDWIGPTSRHQLQRR